MAAGRLSRRALLGGSCSALLLLQNNQVLLQNGQALFQGGAPAALEIFPDGYGPGFYFPAEIYAFSNAGGAAMPIATGFARGLNAPSYSLSNLSTSNLVLLPGVGNGCTLVLITAQPAGTATGTITASDGVNSYSQDFAVYSGPNYAQIPNNYVLDTLAYGAYGAAGPGYGSVAGQVNPGNFSPVLTDPLGLFVWTGGLVCIETLATPSTLQKHYGLDVLTVANGATSWQVPMFVATELAAQARFVPAGQIFDWHPTLAEFAQQLYPTGALIGHLVTVSDAGIAKVGFSDPTISLGSGGQLFAKTALVAGTHTVDVTITSATGRVTVVPFEYTVLPGNLLQASSHGSANLQTLDNSMRWNHPDTNLNATNGDSLQTNYNGVAASLAFTGLTAPITIEMHVSSDECQELRQDTGTFLPRYSIVSTGALTANLMMAFGSAQTDVVEVRASDAQGNCVHLTVDVAVSAKVGPVVTIDKTQTQSATVFPSLDALFGAVWASAAAVQLYSGMTVMLANQDYSNDGSRPNCSINRGSEDQVCGPLGGFRASYFPCPVTLKGISPVGTVVLDFRGKAPALSQQAGIVCQDFDMTMQYLTIKNVGQAFGNAGEPNAGALYGQESLPGNIHVMDCHFYNSNDGFIGGTAGNHLLFERCTFAWDGTGTYGLTHNLYCGIASSLTMIDCVSYATTAGNTLKSRAARTTLTRVKCIDSENGASSRCLDIPLGGIAVITDCLMHKGANPNTNNSQMITMFEECNQQGGGNGSPWPNNSLTVTGTQFLCTMPTFASTAAVAGITLAPYYQTSIPIVGSTTGNAPTFTVTGNQYYNIPLAQLVDNTNGYANLVANDNTALTAWPGIPNLDPSTNAPYVDLPGPSFSQYAQGYGGVTFAPPAFEFRVAAGAAAGTAVCTPALYDDYGFVLANQAWTITGPNASLFSLNASTGQVTVAGTIPDGLLYFTLTGSGTVVPNKQTNGSMTTAANDQYSHNVWVVGGTGYVAAA